MLGNQYILLLALKERCFIEFLSIMNYRHHSNMKLPYTRHACLGNINFLFQGVSLNKSDDYLLKHKLFINGTKIFRI